MRTKKKKEVWVITGYQNNKGIWSPIVYDNLEAARKDFEVMVEEHGGEIDYPPWEHDFVNCVASIDHNGEIRLGKVEVNNVAVWDYGEEEICDMIS